MEWISSIVYIRAATDAMDMCIPISINAAARLNGLSYSQFMHGLKLAGADLNRKVLADMAVTDAEGFAKLVEVAKKALA